MFLTSMSTIGNFLKFFYEILLFLVEFKLEFWDEFVFRLRRKKVLIF